MSTVPPSASSPKRVSSAGYWIALAIFVVGCGAAAVWLVVALVGVYTAPDDYARTTIPGSMQVEIGTGEWVIYEEGPSLNSKGIFAEDLPFVEVSDPAGDPVTLDYDDNFSTTYTNDGNDGRSVASFDADVAGVYQIDVSGEPSSPVTDIAVGRPLFDGAVVGIVGSIALGAISFLVALVLLIVTIVRRSRAKKALAASPYRPVPAAPGAPGSFAAPIPTAPVGPRPPVTPGPPPAPGAYGGPVVPPPAAPPVPTSAAPTSPYTPGWAAPTPPPAAVPPPPAATGFAAPGGTPAPFEPTAAEPTAAEPPAPEPTVPEPPEPQVPEPPATEATESDEPEAPPANEGWDKPGHF